MAYVNADPGIPVFGSKGAAIHVQEVLRALLKRGAHLQLFATRFANKTSAEFRSVTCHEVPVLKAAQPAEREKAAIDASITLADAMASAARLDPFDLLYERYSLWSCAALEFARERGIPAVLEVNAPLIDEQSRHRVLVDRKLAEEIGARAFAAATVITTVSNQLAETIGRHPAAQGKIHVVPNGVNPERFQNITATIPRGADEYVIGFVGSLKPWHGLGTLADAFLIVAERLPGSRLLIVGDGPERDGFQKRLAEAGLQERVRFTGSVSPNAVPGLLASMDVAVAPYPRLDDFYFSPLKVFEYMGAGLAIVGSRIGQVEEVIEHGRSGLLVAPGDAYELASSLCELAASPDRRRTLGAAAREKALRDHTWDRAVARVLELVRLPAIAGS